MMNKAIKYFLNAFIFLIVLDVIFSFSSYVAKIFPHSIYNGILNLSNIITFISIFLAFILYVLMIFFRNIPKTVFLPQAVFYFIAPMLVYPIKLFGMTLDEAGLILSTVELVILFITLYHLKISTGSAIIMELSGNIFSWKNLFGSLLMTVLLLFPSLTFLLTFNTVKYVEHESNGFIDVNLKAIQSVRKTYIKTGDTSEVELIGMMHIGDSSFYNEMLKTFDFKDSHEAVILSEGVSDSKNLISDKFNYKKLAGSVGLVSQENHYFDPKKYNIIRADVDTSNFSKKTVDMLNTVAKVLNGENIPFEEKIKFLKFSKDIKSDIIKKRNKHLINVFKSVDGKYKKIIIPWGALHMPAFEKYLIKMGFKLENTYHYDVVRF